MGHRGRLALGFRLPQWCPEGAVSFVESLKSRGRIRGDQIPLMSSHTIRLHRVLKAAPEKIYRAFLDADALAKWLPPFGFTCQVHSLDAKVGGTYRMTFTNFTTQGGNSFGGTYRELVPGE